MKKIFLLSLIFFYVSAIEAQKANPRLDSGTIAARLSFLSLIDIFDESLTLGGEYHFNPHHSAGFDASYIFSSLYYSSRTGGKVSGYIIKPFYRRYYDMRGKRIKFFFEPDVFLKHETFYANEWVQRPNFQEEQEYKIWKNVWGANCKVGFRFRIIPHGKMFMEVYGGIGLRGCRTSLSDTTISNFTVAGINRGGSDEKLNTDYYYASVPLGVRFTYVFCKRRK